MKLNTSFIQPSLLLKIIFISLLSINSIFSNSNRDLKSLDSSFIISQDSLDYTEKVYLHFDKPYYSSGEYLWFKTYLVSADTNRPDSKSKIVHVELIDSTNKIVDSRIIKIENGGGEGEFYLPKKFNAGIYTIRAYTNFMRNFDASYYFTKEINIGNPYTGVFEAPIIQSSTISDNLKKIYTNNGPDVQFFPEGGHMIANRTSNIGFKAIGTDGKSISVSGTIIDSQSNEIISFETTKFGLGKFELTPKKGEEYEALITHNGTNYSYILPKALDKGVTMEVKEKEDKYQILLQSTLPKGIHRLSLTGLQNGKIVTISELKGRYKSGVINVPKNYLKRGIVQFTITDKDQIPICERLVFFETTQPKSNLTISSDKKAYLKRERIELDLDLTGVESANTSLSVTDISVVRPDLNSLDIESYLMLKSELKGTIEQPGYYFQSKNQDRMEALDLLMMTQGWRQFLWDYEDEQMAHDKIIKFDHETGIRLNGIVRNKPDLENTASAEVSLTYMNGDEFVEEKRRTSKNGIFQFGDFQFNDTTSVYIQAKNYLIKKRRNNKVTKKVIKDYNITLDPFSPAPLPREKSIIESELNVEVTSIPVHNDFLERSKKVRLNSVIPFDDDSKKLDEVTVKHKRALEEKEAKFKNRNTIYGTPSHRVNFDDVSTVGTSTILAALQGKVPGLRISGNVNNPLSYFTADGETISNYQIRLAGGGFSLTGGQNQPLILLDNMPVYDLPTVLVSDISYVDILSPTRAAIFGSRAIGGVISIHTKRGSELIRDRERKGIINFIHPGFYKARKFYEPNYRIKKPEHQKPDYRTTIHWHPELKLTKNNKAKVSFYAADVETTYRIDLQGISENGIPITKELYVTVE